MDILYLLDRLETVLTSGSRVPLTGKTVVDEHECLDIIDQLRVAVPEEVKQAKRVQGEREQLSRRLRTRLPVRLLMLRRGAMEMVERARDSQVGRGQGS